MADQWLEVVLVTAKTSRPTRAPLVWRKPETCQEVSFSFSLSLSRGRRSLKTNIYLFLLSVLNELHGRYVTLKICLAIPAAAVPAYLYVIAQSKLSTCKAFCPCNCATPCSSKISFLEGKEILPSRSHTKKMAYSATVVASLILVDFAYFNTCHINSVQHWILPLPTHYIWPCIKVKVIEMAMYMP